MSTTTKNLDNMVRISPICCQRYLFDVDNKVNLNNMLGIGLIHCQRCWLKWYAPPETVLVSRKFCKSWWLGLTLGPWFGSKYIGARPRLSAGSISLALLEFEAHTAGIKTWEEIHLCSWL